MLEISFTADSDYKNITSKSFNMLPGAKKQSDEVCREESGKRETVEERRGYEKADWIEPNDR